MGCFLPLLFLFTAIAHFSQLSVIACWLGTIGFTLALAHFRPIDNGLDPGSAAGDERYAIACLLLLAAAIAALLPAINIYPWIIDGGLYCNTPTADHIKVAFTDAIVREGLPLRNPFYAPLGQRILLSYSYGWYVLAAAVKLLTHATGWQAEVAMSWMTSFSVITFLVAQAWRLTASPRAGAWLILLFLMGPLSSDLLPVVLGAKWLPFVGLPSNHGLELVWLQLAWAPQHVFSALCIVLMLWLISLAMASEQMRFRLAMTVGFLAAAGFESSIWVGGVALGAATPLLIAAALLQRLPWQRYRNLIALIAVAAVVCFVCSIPLLRGLSAGTAKFQDQPPIAFSIFPSTLLEDYLGLSGNAKLAARIVLYWVHLLPLSFGAIYVLGLPAMLLWRPGDARQRALRAVAIAATLGFLLVSQFIRSTILANDLGWRAVNVAEMFMLIWGGAAMAALTDRAGKVIARWNVGPRLRSLREPALALAFALLLLGLLSLVRGLSFPIPVWPADSLEHRLFAEQARAWAIVRRYTKPTDLVQMNPDGFPKVTPWQISLPYHLFADRSTAYACVGTGRTYAFRYSQLDNDRQYLLIRQAFYSRPRVLAIRALRFRFNVKAIVVTPQDGVWRSDAIERSGLYRRVAATDAFRVYIARSARR
jgi:hypothetical protein